jgi:hypothetical protein
MNLSRASAFIRKYLDEHRMRQALGKAVEEALKQHRKAGHKVPVWQNGGVVYVEPNGFSGR